MRLARLCRFKQVAFSSLLILAASACKTNAPATQSAVKDFNTGSNPDLQISYVKDYLFCPAATKFNIANAYWLTLADAYVYGSESSVNDVVTQLQEWGPVKPEFLASPDSHNPLVASSQALWLETDNIVILAFRGTPLDRIDAHDITSDLKALPVDFLGTTHGKVHQGFNLALENLWNQINPKLKALSGTQKSLFITGHSLGAALATLATARIMMTPELEPVRKNVKGLYTIGTPRVGTSSFAKNFKKAYEAGPAFPIIRIRNHDDIVTRALPAPYVDLVGSLVYLKEDGHIYSPELGPSFSRYAGNDLTIRMDSLPSELGNLTDHFPTNYFAKISTEYVAHQTWAKDNQVSDACADEAFYKTVPISEGVVPGINSLDDLVSLSNDKLLEVFSKGEASPDLIPSVKINSRGLFEADGKGLPIIIVQNPLVNSLATNFWEGKKFNTQNGKTTLVNKLANNVIDDISADVTYIPEGLSGDGKPSILLNYAKSNRFAARSIRDEIRQVAPGLYLGRAYLRVFGMDRFVVWFALKFAPETN